MATMLKHLLEQCGFPVGAVVVVVVAAAAAAAAGVVVVAVAMVVVVVVFVVYGVVIVEAIGVRIAGGSRALVRLLLELGGLPEALPTHWRQVPRLLRTGGQPAPHRALRGDRPGHRVIELAT